MKILIASSKYHPYYWGGGEYSVKKLAEELSKYNDVEVEVLTFGEENNTEVISNVKVRRIKSKNIYWSYFAKKQSIFKKIIWHLLEAYNPRAGEIANLIATEIKPDLVHFRNIEDFSTSIFKYLSKHKIPTIQTLNTYFMIEPSGTLYRTSKAGYFIMKIWEQIFRIKKYGSNWLSAVVGVSQLTLNEHIRRGYYRNSKQAVIRTGVQKVNSNQSKRKNDNITFGFIGNLYETKGVLEMITAFKILKGQNINLIVAGAGNSDYSEKCHKLAKDDNRIKFLGKTDQETFFTQIDVSIIPSIWMDPFPRVLIEAYSFGKPVISSNKGGAKERVVQGVTGFIYRNEEELIESMEKLISEPKLISTFSNNIKSWAKIHEGDDIDQYYSLYKEIINTPQTD
ncbi:Glycosyltransferase involved in cell wall bisynthesis [Reichenbachiella faecimaris]|uniref:Glycosyltransferase involved in cell wall bisynthesis n=1 Tax=Reichenbachiella faecimaris TaxID=692418 RepID=A0A1W2GCP6_REIFA|nr:glycosyltransferase [Reichenbachiella faecimaris]SMD34371.1 Glycosyltransferase involved in cell wall bisynthesis [Reichenbachiella faecimaris]